MNKPLILIKKDFIFVFNMGSKIKIPIGIYKDMPEKEIKESILKKLEGGETM